MVDPDDDADMVVVDGAVRPVDKRRDEGMRAYPRLLLLLNEGAGGDGQRGRGSYAGQHEGGKGQGEVRPP